MLRSLLVGIDGSDDCVAAVELGIQWAKRFRCLLVAIGVVDEPSIRGSQPEGKVSRSYQGAYDQLLKNARREVEQALENLAIRCSEEQIAFKLLEEEGEPCDRILTEMQRYDLMLLGCKTHFRHGSERHPCVTLERVLRNAPRPVVVTPADLCENRGDEIVIAYDGSVQSARALQAFLATGLAATGPIHVFTVHRESSIEAARIADRAIEFLRFHEIDAERVSLASDASPSKLFLDFATKRRAGLLVMGAYGQPRVSEFFFGSATCSALKESKLPLLLFH